MPQVQEYSNQNKKLSNVIVSRRIQEIYDHTVLDNDYADWQMPSRLEFNRAMLDD